MSLQQIILAILQALLALARIPTSEHEAALRTRKQLRQHKDELDTFAADSEFNSPEVLEVLGDLEEVLTDSTPSEDYAEVPADPDSVVEGETVNDKEEEAAQTEPEPEPSHPEPIEEAPKPKTKKKK